MIDCGLKKTFSVYSDDEKITRVASIEFLSGSKNPQIDICFVSSDSAVILSRYTFLAYRTGFYVESDNPRDYPVYIHNITERFVTLHIYDFSQDGVAGGIMGYRMTHENFVLSVSEQSDIVIIKIPGFSDVQAQSS